MQKRRLGRTDLHVSAICLGTMTWGQQNTEEEGHRQMDVAFDRGNTARAIDRLEAAVATRDPGIEPLASFQLARAKARADDGDGARAGFNRVVEGWSGTAWADQAARALTALDEKSKRPVWASAELGFEADDNALIRGRGVGRPNEVSGQSDVRGYWFVDTGALWLKSGSWSSGTALRYGGSENRRIERFNTHAPGATLWLDRALAWQGSALRLQYDVDAAWIGADTRGDDPFLVSHLWSTSLFKPWSSGGATTSLTASLGLDDYGYRRRGLAVADVGQPGCQPCSPAGVDEVGATNRDGFGPILSDNVIEEPAVIHHRLTKILGRSESSRVTQRVRPLYEAA